MLARKILNALQEHTGADPLDLYEIVDMEDLPILSEEAYRLLMKDC
jgi:hypothetical protein